VDPAAVASDRALVRDRMVARGPRPSPCQALPVADWSSLGMILLKPPVPRDNDGAKEPFAAKSE